MSRRIDQLIVEHVMQWARVKEHCHVQASWIDHHGNRTCPDFWRPSTDIAAAWEVVEKMRSERWEPAIDGLARTWEVLFNKGGERGLFEHTSAPMAICLAALRAKGIEVTDDTE